VIVTKIFLLVINQFTVTEAHCVQAWMVRQLWFRRLSDVEPGNATDFTRGITHRKSE